MSNGTQWTVDDLVDHLQDAVELELFTIPLYLTAMYSIRDTSNPAYALISSVVNQEMLHLQLACNTLNALGMAYPFLTEGTNSAGQSVTAAPKYPEAIPFITPAVTAHLAPFSIIQNQLFMTIETPTWDDPNPQTTDPLPAYDTIGEFYDAIEAGIAQLSQQSPPAIDFGAGADRQVSGIFPDDLAVTSVQTADQALDLIISQGEGTSVTNPDDSEGDLAHYYKFAEIAQNPGWVTNPTDPSQPQVIYKMLIDPATYTYNQQQEALLAFFDGAYSYLLLQLQEGFGGDTTTGNTNQVNNAVGLMFSVIDPLLKYIIQQPYDGQPAGYNLAPRYLYSNVSTSDLQTLYNNLAPADRTNAAVCGAAGSGGLGLQTDANCPSSS